MKKLVTIFIILITCLSLNSCSCKKKANLDYKYVGAYVDLVEVKERTMNDRNIKLYYDEAKDTLVDSSQIYEYQLSTSFLTKNIKEDDGRMVYDIAAQYMLTLSSEIKLDKVDVYPIVYDGEKYSIKDDKKTITLVNKEIKGVSFAYSYFYEKEEYAFKISIKILKKEV